MLVMSIVCVFIGVIIGFLCLAVFVASKPERDSIQAFEDGVSYALDLHLKNGGIIATNGNEIMVQYEDGTMKRFREVEDE